MSSLEVIGYEHAAALIGATPYAVSRDPDLLAQAHARCCECYGTKRQVIGIDVYNLEAEALGAVIAPLSTDGVPMIGHHPCDGPEAIGDLPELELNRGRLGMTLDAADRFARRCAQSETGVPLAGPYGVATGLVGMEAMLCGLVGELELEATREALLRLVDLLRPWHRAVARAGHRPVVFESGVAPPLMPPAAFEYAVLPALRQMLRAIAEDAGRPAILIIGGNCLPIAQSLATLPVAQVIAPRQTDQGALLEIWRTRRDVTVRVNMNPAVFSAQVSDEAAIEQEWRRAQALAAGRDNTTVGTGVLAYDADPARVQRAIELACNPSR